MMMYFVWLGVVLLYILLGYSSTTQIIVLLGAALLYITVGYAIGRFMQPMCHVIGHLVLHGRLPTTGKLRDF